MTIIPVSISSLLNCEVIGFLYESSNPVDLGQDMLSVTTATGIIIDAGWSDEGDPDGCYVVSASSGLRAICKPFRTRDCREAAECVQKWARYFSGLPVASPASNSVTVNADSGWSDGEYATEGGAQVLQNCA